MTALIVRKEPRTTEQYSLQKRLLSVDMSFRRMEIINILMYTTDFTKLCSECGTDILQKLFCVL